MLDVAAEDAVGVVGPTDVLELVEDDQRPPPSVLAELERQVEEGMERRQGSRLGSSWSRTPMPTALNEVRARALQELLDARPGVPFG